MNKRTKIFLGISMALFTLTGAGCGGGGSNTAADTKKGDTTKVTGTTTGTTKTGVTVSTVKTGYFIDAAVIGVEYQTTSGRHGKTNSKGQFSYEEGDRVTFKIGQLELGSARPDADGLVTPWSICKDIAAGNHELAKEKESLLLRVLQSLDVDHNPEKDGIRINPKLHQDLKYAQHASVVELTEDTILSVHESLRTELDKNSDGRIDVRVNEAHEHAVNGLGQWNIAHGFAHDAHDNAHDFAHDIHENAHDHAQDVRDNAHDQAQDVTDNAHDQAQDVRDNIHDFVNGHTKNNNPAKLKADQKYALAYMWNEERLAKDIYSALNEIYPVKVFENVAKAEAKHVQAVESLVKKYDVNINDTTDFTGAYSASQLAAASPGRYAVAAVQGLYDELYAKGVQSKVDALQVACMVETTDIKDLESYIAVAQQTRASDLITVFENLKTASHKHYWAFDKALKAEGVASGCASLGEEYADPIEDVVTDVVVKNTDKGNNEDKVRDLLNGLIN